MSKRLIKILSICALVILCPLVIVGVSLMATEAVGCTLTIFDGGIEQLGEKDFGGKSSNVTIMVDGKAQESNKVTLTKHTEVTVTFEGVGYDFVGWFDGNYNEINRVGEGADKAVSEKVSYTFEISKDTVLTAVRDIKTYNVTYDGFYDDGTTEIALESATLEYNQPLETLVPMVGGVQAGWYNMVEGVAGVTTRVANFETSGDVTVYPAWEDQMLVEYIKADGTVISSVRLFEGELDTYALLDDTDVNIKNNLTAGYDFAGWTNQSGGEVVTAITYDKNGIKLVLNETLSIYTLNVKFNALSEESAQITYNVKDGFSAYDVERENYTFVGFEYNGTVYNYDDATKGYGTLASVIMEAGEKTADVTAVWECNYEGLFFDFGAIAEYEYEGKTKFYLLVANENGSQVDMEKIGQPINFVDAEGASNVDANLSVYDYFVGAYTDIATLNGEAVQFTGDIDIMVEGAGVTHTLSLPAEQLTFAKILSFVGSSLAHGTLEGVTRISIDFIFEVV